MYKNEFGINDLQWLMCHKTKPNKTKPIFLRWPHLFIVLLVDYIMLRHFECHFEGKAPYLFPYKIDMISPITPLDRTNFQLQNII